jgi:hypothetical protein
MLIKISLAILSFLFAFYGILYAWLVLWRKKVIFPPQGQFLLWLLGRLGKSEEAISLGARMAENKWNRLWGVSALVVGIGFLILGITMLPNLF